MERARATSHWRRVLVREILHSRIYLGEVVLRGEWYPGKHEPIITPADFEAAHRGRVPGRRQGKDLLSSRVRCGRCGKLMHVEDNGSGHRFFRCRNRGAGCALPRRSTRGLHRAVLLGLQLIGHDEELREAIRRELEAAGREPRPGRSPAASTSAKALAALLEQRRKLLRLHYDGRVDEELFGEEQQRLTKQIEALRAEEQAHAEESESALPT